MKIYIAEDDKIVRQGLRQLLQTIGPHYTIIGEASNGRAALDDLQNAETDLLITDIKMPVMDGIELIKAIKAGNPQLKIIVLSGFNEFDYVRESLKYGATDYLLKPVDADLLRTLLGEIEELVAAEKEKQEQLAKSKNLLQNLSFLKEHFLLQVLDTESDPRNTEPLLLFIEDIKKIGTDQYIAVTASLSGGDRAGLEQIERVNRDVLALLGAQANLFAISYPLSPQETMFIVMSRSIHQSSLLQLTLVTFYHAIKSGLFPSVTFGLSNVHTSFDHIRKAYLETRLSLQQRYLNNNDPIICYTPAFEEQRSDYEEDVFEESLAMIMNQVKVGHLAAARETLASLFDTIEQAKLKPEKLRQTLVYLAEALFKQIGGADKAGGREKLREIAEQESYQSAKARIIAELELLFEGAAPKSDKNRLIEMAKEHIDNNYFMDLNLKTLADLLFVHPNYFSELFKARTGKNFVDYLAEVRIEAAKRLLADQELKIYQVANLAGFHETVSFNRTFKKMTGVTPRDYRNHLL